MFVWARRALNSPKRRFSARAVYAINEMGLGPEVSKFYSSLFRGNKKAAATLKLRRNIVLVRLLETAAFELPVNPKWPDIIPVDYRPRHLTFFVDVRALRGV